MELYEVLFTVPASEVENGDLIRFDHKDEEGKSYTEVIRVDDVSYDSFRVIVHGYSETLNDFQAYSLIDHLMVEVLGG